MMLNRKMRPQDVIFGGGMIDSLLSKFTYANPKYPGEMHGRVGIFGTPYNFCGPKTHYSERILDPIDGKSINKLDEVCKQHDKVYYEVGNKVKSGQMTKQEGLKQIHNADSTFIKDARTQKDDPIMGQISASLIGLKKAGESIGVLPINKFSLSGSGKRPRKMKSDPAKKLRELCLKSEKPKETKKKEIKGGNPVLIPIAAAVASTLVGKLWDTIRDKLRGGGISIPFRYHNKKNRTKYINRLKKAITI